DRDDVDIGRRFPRGKRLRNRALPGAVAEPGVKRRVQVGDAVVPLHAVGHDAVGDWTRVGPAVAALDVVYSGNGAHQPAVFQALGRRSPLVAHAGQRPALRDPGPRCLPPEADHGARSPHVEEARAASDRPARTSNGEDPARASLRTTTTFRGGLPQKKAGFLWL